MCRERASCPIRIILLDMAVLIIRTITTVTRLHVPSDLFSSNSLIAYPSGRLVAGVAGSNPARGIDVCLLCLYVVLSCVGRGLC
jgi:hypothetical protein